MKHSYSPKGVCPTHLEFDLEDGIVKNISFRGGCNGNLKAIATLCEGMPAEELQAKLSGIRCGFKASSCSDQLAQAVSNAIKNEA